MAVGIVAAGGGGERLGATVAKFEAALLGRPMVLYSLEAFQRASRIHSIILVAPADRLGDWSVQRLRSAGIGKAVATVGGGATRQESVLAGLRRAGVDEGVVVIHDAARPLITPTLIDRVAEIPEGASGVIAAISMTDTIKRVEGTTVKETLDRAALVAVQTPQAFRLQELLSAHARAVELGLAGTDDASLVEAAGGVIEVVEGSRDNLKVTYPHDMLLAGTLMQGRMV